MQGWINRRVNPGTGGAAERPTLPGGRERLRRNGLIAALAVVIVGVCVAAALNASGLALAVDQKAATTSTTSLWGWPGISTPGSAI